MTLPDPQDHDAPPRRRIAEWSPVCPNPPESVWHLTDEPLRQRSRTAWEQAHVLISAVTAWQDWIANAERQSGQEIDPSTLHLMNELGDKICRDGRKALQALNSLCLTVPAFATSTPDLEEEARWGAASPVSHWPTPPSEILDCSWYYDPSVPHREATAVQLVLMHSLAEAAQMLLDLLETNPEAAFEIPAPIRGSSPRLPTVANAFLGVSLDRETMSLRRAGHDATVLFASKPEQWPIIVKLVQAGEVGLTGLQRREIESARVPSAWRELKNRLNQSLAPVQLVVSSDTHWVLKDF